MQTILQEELYPIDETVSVVRDAVYYAGLEFESGSSNGKAAYSSVKGPGK